MTARPNIVFLFTDDQRFDTIHALGNARIHTPTMDWLLAQGTACTHAHIPGGTVPAVCMPSRAMLHSGRTLFHLTGAGEEIAPEHATLGETLRKHGYRTFGAGKWHNGPAAYHRSFTDGAEIFFGGMADHWNVPAYDFDPTGAYDQTCLQVPEIWTSNATVVRQCDHIHAGRHSTDVIADATLRFLQAYTDEAPFFIFASFLAPHDPRTMPKQYLEMYDPAQMPLPENFLGGHPFNNGELHVRDEMLAGFPRTPEEIRRHIAEYYAMITHLDARIGDIIAAVRAQGKLEETIVVLAGDNGLAIGQHGLMGKQSLYEHSTRVPLIFAGPGIPRGARTDALVYLLDIFPTLCAMAEVPVPASVEGENLLPVLQGKTGGRQALYLAYADKHRGVRTDRYKLIEYVVDGRHAMTQLFDLWEDPHELHNLAEDPRQAGRVQEMRAELFRLRNAWEDEKSPWGQRFWQGWRQ